MRPGVRRLPRRFGTLDELFESLTLIQTLKIHPFPVFLVGSPFWSELVAWIGDTLAAQGTISPEESGLFRVVDEVDGVPAMIDVYHPRPDHAGFHLPTGA